MRAVKQIPIERLRECLNYDPETGIVTRRIKYSRSVLIGQVVGKSYDGRGYLVFKIDDCRMYLHRAIWAMAYGEWPASELEVDHIDRDKGNNRIANLRLATHSENKYNIGGRKSNTSGAKGVHWNKQRNRWQAEIMVAGEKIYLGLFDSVAAAARSYQTMARTLHGDFYVTGDPAKGAGKLDTTGMHTGR